MKVQQHSRDTYKNGSGNDVMTDMIDADGEKKTIAMHDEWDDRCMNDGWVNGMS
jgi:hypothetical protein